MEFIPGTDTSKKIEEPEKEPKIQDFQDQGRKKCIDKFTLNKNGNIIAARRHGVIEIYDDEFEISKQWTCEQFEGRFVGLELIGDTIVTADEKGNLFIIDSEKEDEIHHLKISNGHLSKLVYEHELFAFGGKEVDLQVVKIDLKSHKVTSVFKAKNVKNDRLDLSPPVWVTDIMIVDPTHYVVSTHYGQIRQYDSSHGRRPTQDTKVGTHALKQLVRGPREDIVIFSDSHSTAEQFNLKKLLVSGKYSGPTGSLQAMHSAERVLAMGGLDRYLRVYNTSSREQVGKIYIGTQITDVHVLEDDSSEPAEIENKESDEMWDELKQLGDRSAKRRKKE